jgi:hypothetical protein
MSHLRVILRQEFLIESERGTKYVAWNGNRFDAYFIAAALITDPELIVRPYFTKSKTLRGMRVMLKDDTDSPNVKAWEFLDGIAMLGLQGVSLEKLLDNFAPEHRKLKEAIDFEREEFDPANPKHCEYAMRDSVGLWHAMNRAQNIMLDTFNEPLRVTMGGTCVRIFQAHIPRDVVIEQPEAELENVIAEYVMRGGFCYCAKRYKGPIWKYDINQAYAAAMREADLPCGGVISGKGTPPRLKCFVIKIRAAKRSNKIPFYFRTDDLGRLRSRFGITTIETTWITSIEYRQLVREGWKIERLEWYAWGSSFNMREYVDKLETLRMKADGGPSGPIGTMIKATGNHSYGKTIERIEPIEFMLSAEQPDDYLPYYGDGSNPLDFVWFRFDKEQRAKAYHKPQIGAFITAYVRMVLRRAALLMPDAWLYADTDCVVFSSDVSALLDIDAKRYGAWKIEEAGALYEIIAKKVYTELETLDPASFVGPDNPKLKRSAKGLHVKKLSSADFDRWFHGEAPEQNQVQLQTLLSVLCGAEMYREQKRRGTLIEAKKAA